MPVTAATAARFAKRLANKWSRRPRRRRRSVSLPAAGLQAWGRRLRAGREGCSGSRAARARPSAGKKKGRRPCRSRMTRAARRRAAGNSTAARKPGLFSPERFRPDARRVQFQRAGMRGAAHVPTGCCSEPASGTRLARRGWRVTFAGWGAGRRGRVCGGCIWRAWRACLRRCRRRLRPRRCRRPRIRRRRRRCRRRFRWSPLR